MRKLDLPTISFHMDSLDLSLSTKRLADALLVALDEETVEATVQTVHEQVFPMSTLASANSALNRLLRAINDRAQDRGIAFEAKITPDKKLGPGLRKVWFEGKLPLPELARTDDLDEARRRGEIQDQQAYFFPAGLPGVLLVCFNDNEEQAVMKRFLKPGQKPLSLPGIPVLDLGELGGVEVFYSRSAQTSLKAQASCAQIVQTLRPQAVIATGIAFGINKKEQKIGDVLVADKIIDYEVQRVGGKKTVHRGEQPPSSPLLQQAFTRTRTQWIADGQKPVVHIGAVLCGNKLIDNEVYRNSLLDLAHNIIGGEMEGMGIYHSCSGQPNPIHWIVVKGISDWADGRKNADSKEADQRQAAGNAAMVVYDTIIAGGLAALRAAPLPLTAGQQELAGYIPERQARFHDKDAPEFPVPANLEELSRERFLSLSAAVVRLDKNGEVPLPRHEGGTSIMRALHAWAGEQDTPDFFALLGEYGMGKTVTCQYLYRELLEERKKTPPTPMPFLFDLRNVTGLSSGAPSIRAILEECMSRGWMAPGSGERYTLEKLTQLLGQQPSLVIFDGLDEALVKLNKAEGQLFTQSLLDFCDDYNKRRTKKTAPRLKLLISCRVQFFRTLNEQQNHFTGQERGKNAGREFASMALLPLNETQVLAYLGHALPGLDPQTIVDTLRSVHDLEELSRRPFTLGLIATLFPEIERERMQGKRLYGVTLYRKMVQRWLDRDEGKHHIKPEHKIILACHLAAHLWKEKNAALPAVDIENWFTLWRDEQPVFRSRYRDISMEQLEEDLRNSTFLTRIDEPEGSVFRFAHTSLQEYFLALHLFNALEQDTCEAWDMGKPSNESLGFLGQMLAESGSHALIVRLNKWGREPHTRRNMLILQYVLQSARDGYPAPSLQGIQLLDADLHDFSFTGATGSPLDMYGANFSGANLAQARFKHVLLDQALFAGTFLIQTEFLDSSLRAVDWSGAETTATVWRKCDLSGGQWEGTQWNGGRFYRCSGQPAAFPAGTDTFSVSAGYGRKGEALSLLLDYTQFSEGYGDIICVTDEEVIAFSGGHATCYSLATGYSLRSFFLGRYVYEAVYFKDADIIVRGMDGFWRFNSISGACARFMSSIPGGQGLSFSPDRRFAAVFQRGHVLIVDLQSGEEACRLILSAEVALRGLWSPQNNTFALAVNQKLFFINAFTGEQTSAQTKDAFTDFAWFPCGQKLCLAGEVVVQLDLKSKETVFLYPCPLPHEYFFISMSPDGSYLLFFSFNRKRFLLNLATGRTERLQQDMVSCQWSRDSTRFISTSTSGIEIVSPNAISRAIRVKNCSLFFVQTRQRINGETCPRKAYIKYLLASNNKQNKRGTASYLRGAGQPVLTPTGEILMPPDSSLYLYTVEGERIWKIPYDLMLWGRADFEKKGKFVVFSTHGGIGAITLETGANRFEYKEKHDILCVLVAESGRGVACGTYSGEISLHGTTDGKSLWEQYLPKWSNEMRHRSYLQCRFSLDEDILYASNHSRLWALNAHNGKLLWNKKLPANVSDIDFSPDGATVAIIAEGKLFLLPLSDKGKIRSFSKNYIGNRCAWSPDSGRIVCSGPQSIALLDVYAGQVVFEGTSRLYRGQPAWEDDGSSFKLVSDSSVVFWNAHTCALEKIFWGSDDGYIIWNPQTNEIYESEGEIWRFMRWSVTDAAGKSEVVPFDAFEATYAVR